MKILKIILLVGLLNLGNVVYGQSTRVGAAGFLSQFGQYRRTSSKQNPASRSRDLNTEGVKRVTRHEFKSKQPAPGERNTYLNFRLSVYEYQSVEGADSAFAALRDAITVKQKDLPDKSPVYVLLHGDTVYWLSGACLYSRTNWDAIEAKLQRALLGQAEPAADKAIKIFCGGELAGRSVETRR
jgi:hypothetical protein